MPDFVRPHRRQPTRLPRPWDSPGKNTGVGCHFLLQWKVKVKSLSRVWLWATPWTAAHQASPSMGFSRWEDWSGVPSPSPCQNHSFDYKDLCQQRDHQRRVFESHQGEHAKELSLWTEEPECTGESPVRSTFPSLTGLMSTLYSAETFP